jgi:hypothetical protein
MRVGASGGRTSATCPFVAVVLLRPEIYSAVYYCARPRSRPDQVIGTTTKRKRVILSRNVLRLLPVSAPTRFFPPLLVETGNLVGIHHPTVAICSRRSHDCRFETDYSERFLDWVLLAELGKDRIGVGQTILEDRIYEVIIESEGRRRKPTVASKLENQPR